MNISNQHMVSKLEIPAGPISGQALSGQILVQVHNGPISGQVLGGQILVQAHNGLTSVHALPTTKQPPPQWACKKQVYLLLQYY